MSFARNYVPLGLAIVFGITNGYYAFQPILRDEHAKKEIPPKTVSQTSSTSSDPTSQWMS
ncbi:hypothetical protein ANO14919_041590 [Xylariales sp. No.14919]|nr:hypothetical protein F5X98DRAFT_325509 [Xylaria grammica]GAW14756.1 hypothetical protein ANO14919_041590 [Xylariales sp. No.14919]